MCAQTTAGPHCIYCRTTGSSEQFRGREHVVPQAFGTFVPDNMVLRSVCDDCNNSFGRTIDLKLARDSFEGLQRFDFEIKPTKDYKNLGRRSSLVYTIDEGPAKGALAYLMPSPETGELVLIPLPQIGFSNEPLGPYTFFMLDALPSPAELRSDGYTGDVLHFWCLCDEQLAKEALIAKGLPFDEFTHTFDIKKGDKTKTQLSARNDDQHRRAIAKIAFNYLAYQLGGQFASRTVFDDIRRFILQGIRPTWKPVQADNNPVLGDEPVEGRRRVGHV